ASNRSRPSHHQEAFPAMGPKQSCSKRGARCALNLVRGTLVTLMLLASAAVPVTALAQETTAETDEATTGAPGELLDLPAMALLPDDLPHEGYGVLGGRPVQPEPGDDDYDYWLGDYSLILALPDPDNPAVGGRLIISYVTQYTEEIYAAFRLFDEQELARVDGDLIEGAPTFGDASYLARIAGITPESRLPYQRLEIAFSIDTLVAMVAIEDYIGQEPALEEIEALAEIMVDRIDAVRADEQPGLSAKLLRLETGNDFRVDYDSLEIPLQLDGRAVRLFDDTDEGFQLRAEVWAESGVIDAYQNEQFLQPDGADDVLDQLYVSSRIYRFETEDEAAAFVETAAEGTVANPGALSNAQVVEVSGFDGATSGISYDVSLGEGVTASGIRIWTQVNAYVASVDAEIAGGVALKGVQKLTAAQVACLEDEQRCAAMTVPDSLLNS
ncbi:MAG: hypothetical protein ACRDJH_22825, partial [Thermomicrobiales bacterium]